MEKTIINRTPHPIVILDDNDFQVEIIERSELPPIRLSAITERSIPINGVPTSITKFGEAENMPEEELYVYHIVSQLVKSAFPERRDLLVPAEVVRDAQGNIVGCRSLGR